MSISETCICSANRVMTGIDKSAYYFDEQIKEAPSAKMVLCADPEAFLFFKILDTSL